MKRADRRLEDWARDGTEGPPPIPAATVVPLRDGPDGLRVLMLRRSSKVAFGGMWVFPGGRVDPEDVQAAEAADAAEGEGGEPADLRVARRAAVREAAEEAALELEAETLVPLSHWTPPPITPKRFLTWFFLAAAPEGAIAVDGGEIREHAWMTPSEAFRRRDAAEIELAPPTYVTLHALMAHARVADALESTQGQPPERFATEISLRPDGPVAIWRGDAEYSQGGGSSPEARHRLIMQRGVWRYERTHQGMVAGEGDCP